MCASCGCKKYEESHGDERNITLSDLNDAAQAAGISVKEVAQNLSEAAKEGANESAATRGG